MAFAAKVYKQGPQVLLAACDEALLGQHFAEGKLHLDVLPGFYDGERVDAQILTGMMRGCTMANLIGPDTVALAVSLDLVEEDNVLHVEGVPHAQFLVIES